MRRLGVNIDHVATLRQARGTLYPNPLEAALEAEAGGADQITCHLREDRRHIQEKDVLLLCQHTHRPLNLEMACSPQMLRFALRLRPQGLTFVPERRKELTTEGGLDLQKNSSRLREAIVTLQGEGIQVSLFINPHPEDLQRAVDLGVRCVELHTGLYAEAKGVAQTREFQRLKTVAREGRRLQLKIFSGHGLHYENTPRLVSIPEIEEYNIGHALVSRAVFVGMRTAVAEMKKILCS